MPSHVFSHQHQQHTPFAFHDHQPHPQQHSNIQQYNRISAASNAAAASSTMLSGGPVGPDQRHNMNGNMGAGAGGGIGAGGMGVGGDHGAGGGMSEDDRKTMEWIVQLLNAQTRETALLELSKKREAVPELALVLWHSFGMTLSYHLYRLDGTGTDYSSNTGVMTSLLQEIISVYPLLNPSQLTAAASNRVCNALALLQCVASHPETRQLFLSGTSLEPVLTKCSY
jgi:CCR4-NOT transcription complex subunit 9